MMPSIYQNVRAISMCPLMTKMVIKNHKINVFLKLCILMQFLEKM